MIEKNAVDAPHPTDADGADMARHVSRLKSLLGCDEVTVLALDAGNNRAVRLYTTVSGAFPEAASKPVPGPDWKETVMVRGQPMLTAGEENLRMVFPDAEAILQSGFEAVLNLPVIFEGDCIGSLNCLYLLTGVSLPTEDAIGEAFAFLGDSALPGILSLATRAGI